MSDINKILYDLTDGISDDYTYLGVFMFLAYRYHCKHNYLSADVVKFIEDAFDSNNINFSSLLAKYEQFNSLSDFCDM